MTPHTNIPPSQFYGQRPGLDMAGLAPGSTTPLEQILRIFTQPALCLPGRHRNERARTPDVISPLAEGDTWQK